MHEVGTDALHLVFTHGTLRIVHTTRWVRTLLERSGLFKLLSTGQAG